MNGELQNHANIIGEISSSCLLGTVQVSAVGNIIAEQLLSFKESLPFYDGPYQVTPQIEGVSLSTANRSMRYDVNIRAIPYYEVSNEYGDTVYIGREL